MRGMQRAVRRFVGVLSVGVAARGVGQLINSAAMIEDAAAAFTPLMGGAERATQLVNRLNETAASTPFQFDQISSAANQLLPVMNGNIENTIDTFRMLGDTAGGNAQKLDSITRGYTKALLQERVTLESLNMIAEAGVPIFAEMSENMGVTTARLFEMVSAGEVSTDVLTNTFQQMTSAGGIFFNGMEIASQTFSGRMSTMRDNIKLTAASIGQALLPTAKSLVDQVIELAGRIRRWVDANQDLIKQRVEQVIDNIGRAVRFLRRNWENGLIPAILAGLAAFRATVMVIAGAKGLIAAFKAFQLVFTSFGALLAANPIGLIATAIAALIVGVVLLVKHWDKVTAALKRAWEWFSNLLDNPLIAAALTVFAPFFTIPAMIVKYWEPIKAFFENLFATVGRAIEAISNSGFGQAMGRLFDGDPSTRLFGRNENMIRSQSVTESRSTVDVNFGNMPAGSSVRQTGRARGVTVNYGAPGARL